MHVRRELIKISESVLHEVNNSNIINGDSSSSNSLTIINNTDIDSSDTP